MEANIHLSMKMVPSLVLVVILAEFSFVSGLCSDTASPSANCENVAEGKAATQSSTYPDGTSTNTADLAVNGAFGNCEVDFTHTDDGDTPPYWEVRLGKVYNINSFRIYARVGNCDFPNSGPCSARLAGFALSVGNSSRNYQVCYRAPARQDPGAVVSGTCTTPMWGDRVRVQQPDLYLSLCEVLVYVCPGRKWGADCANTCGQCNNGAVCDKTSGVCPLSTPRCSPGYTGLRCDSCADGKWGANCVNDCGQCINGAVCDKTSGECPPSTPRCSPGYMGTRWDTVCPGRKWGADCANTCGQCNNGAVCDKTSGECPPSTPRCSPGYMGTRCDTVCSAGYFGSLCQNPCGYCVDGNLTCDHVDGTCSNCAAGWQGHLCKQSCSLGTYGPNCKLTCSVNCKDGPTGCDIKTGVCTGGCTEGFSGAYCQSSPDNTGVIVGAVVGVVVLGVVVVIAIIVVIMRRLKRQSPAENPPVSAIPKLPDDKTEHMECENQGQQGLPDIDTSDYYNSPGSEDNAYERVDENEYNSVRFSKLDPDPNYTTLS